MKIASQTQLYAFAALVVLLDQLTKWAITSNFFYGESLPVTGFFNLVLVHNTGAAFSFLSDAGGWQRWLFTLLATGVSLFLVAWIWRLEPGQKLLGYAIALVLGGALGNLWDRIAYGYVIDFLDFYWQRYHFPAFNLADSAITLGVILLLLDSLTASRSER